MQLDHFDVLDEGTLEELAPEAPVAEGQELELKLVEVGLHDAGAGVGTLDGLAICRRRRPRSSSARRSRCAIERVLDGTPTRRSSTGAAAPSRADHGGGPGREADAQAAERKAAAGEAEAVAEAEEARGRGRGGAVVAEAGARGGAGGGRGRARGDAEEGDAPRLARRPRPQEEAGAAAAASADGQEASAGEPASEPKPEPEPAADGNGKAPKIHGARPGARAGSPSRRRSPRDGGEPAGGRGEIRPSRAARRAAAPAADATGARRSRRPRGGPAEGELRGLTAARLPVPAGPCPRFPRLWPTRS